jgi:hypothetical protein
MTEEKFEEIKSLMDSIDRVKSKITTIDKLLETNNISCKVEGQSDCKFKVSRFIYLTDKKSIKNVMMAEKQSLENELLCLQEKFKTL